MVIMQYSSEFAYNKISLVRRVLCEVIIYLKSKKKKKKTLKNPQEKPFLLKSQLQKQKGLWPRTFCTKRKKTSEKQEHNYTIVSN